MDWITLVPSILFFIVGTIAVASAILVVAMRNPVHSALFLLLTFLSVAILFVMLGAEFVGAVQVLVYAGGIMVLFLFVIMLINVRQLPDERMLSTSWKGGAALGLAVFAVLAFTIAGGGFAPEVNDPDALKMAATSAAVGAPMELAGNSEAVSMALYRDYMIPFEIVSLFLLVAMIGAIIIGKRELSAEEEEAQPEFITARAAEERRVKEAMNA
jgi:NADH-quinone oxidoreductase subunit J